MIAAQDAISIPVIYIETFVMTFVAFGIGYMGAVLQAKSSARKNNKKHKKEILKLKTTINALENELDRKEDKEFQKDRMDQDLEQVNFQRRAFSQEILEGKSSESLSSDINFDRIGSATAKQRDDFQLISGIGPYTESKLNDLGIYTFEQISRFTDEDISTITRLIKFFPDRIKNDRWVAKAKALIEDPDYNKKESTRLKKI